MNTSRTEDRATGVGGIILCGGKSSRMGQPKADLQFGESHFLSLISTKLMMVASPIVVVAAADQELPRLPQSVIVARDARPGRGPLEGLSAGFAALKGQADAVFVSSCDAPFLRSQFVQRMVDLLGDSQACVPIVDGCIFPLSGVYRCEIAAVVDEMLAADRLSVVGLLDRVRTRFVSADELVDVDPKLWSLRNINTPEEFAAAARDWNEG